MTVNKGNINVTRSVLVEKLRELGEKIYPGNTQVIDLATNKNFKTEGVGGTNYVLMDILFPEITIKNRDNKSHIITDLIVRLRFYPCQVDNNNRLNDLMTIKPGLSGRRLTVTNEELNEGYRHSHLSGVSVSSIGSWGSFCLGSGPLRTMIPEMTSTNTIDFDILELILYQIDGYVRWESIEGTPYKYIKNIRKTKETVKSLRSSIKRSSVDKLFKNLDKLKKPLRFFNVTNVNGNCNIKVMSNHPDLDEFLVNELKAQNNNDLLCVLRNGKYYSIELGGFTNFLDVGSINYNFNGKEYKKVEEKLSQKKKDENEKEYAHPSIKELFISRFEYEIAKCQINTENKIQNTGESKIDIKQRINVRRSIPPQLNW